AVSVRFSPGSARRLHLDDDLAVCATKRLATRRRDGFAASLENSCDRLCRVRNQGGKDRPDRARDSTHWRTDQRTAREVNGDRGSLPGPSNAYFGNQYQNSSGLTLLQVIPMLRHRFGVVKAAVIHGEPAAAVLGVDFDKAVAELNVAPAIIL